MPFKVSCTPAPVTITIQPKYEWQILVTIAWIAYAGYQTVYVGWRRVLEHDLLDLILLLLITSGILLSFIRRERLEIYPDQMVWRRTYFGFSRSETARIEDVLGAEWSEGEQRGRHGKGPDYVEFYLTNGSVKACFGFTFDDFDRMRGDIGTMYPSLIKRWGNARVRSKSFTLLNLS